MIQSFLDHHPQIAPTAYVADQATVLGRVTLEEEVSVWPQAVLRGDINAIRVGRRSNVQDHAVFHVADDFPCVIGEEVIIGHRATVHAATVEQGALIGIGAVVLDGCQVGAYSILGAGAVLPPGTVVPPRTLWVGVPARKVRDLEETVVQVHQRQAEKYVRLARCYQGLASGW